MLIKDQLKQKKNFTPVEEVISDYLLAHRDDISTLSARTIAKQIGTAPSTLSRFAQKLGFDGFNSFRKAFSEENDYLNSHFNELNINYPFDRNDKNVVLANKIGSLYHSIIDDTLKLIRHDTLQTAISILNKAELIYVVSGGFQSDLAKSFKSKMLKIGKNVVIDNHMENMYYRTAFASQNTAIIFISYSGELAQTLRVAGKAHARHIPSIAITAIGGNSLTSFTDVMLAVSSKEALVENLGGFSMNVSTMLLLDILYVGVFNTDYNRHLERRIRVAKEFELDRHSENSLLNDHNTVAKKKS